MRRYLFVAVMAATTAIIFRPVLADELPPGYWAPERTPEILERTKTVRLAPSLKELSAGEKRALQELLEAGKIIQRIYEDARHPQALEAFDTLMQLSNKLSQPPETQSLLDLYRLFKGPIATTPDNRREAFLPVEPETPARNVYPSNATSTELETYLLAHPDERDALLNERTIVRRVTPANIKRDLDALQKFAAIDLLHPGLRRKLETLQAAKESEGFYAIPYSLRWAPEMTRIYRHLNAAARAIESTDSEFARYLRNRARDLLTDDYESGDAAWVNGNFKRFNAQIGAYETYDDALMGSKAFMSMSLLKRDEAATKQLREAARNIQEIENQLPAPQHRRIREDIPIGVYEVIADFGQSRGRNAATTLPNDPLFVKRYGKIILLRANILRNPELFANTQSSWKALMASPFDGDLSEEGELQRTLWHEIGHYLGLERDKRGRSLEAALQSSADTFEELKADLVALFAAAQLQKAGTYSENELVSIYASGINRTLQDAKPRREQPYQTMQLMQFNWFHDRGVFEVENVTNTLIIHYDRYPEAVAAMLEAVFKIQYEGERAAAEAFIDRWTNWREDFHDVVAKTIRDNRSFQYALFRYSALGE